jgi:hypothetical protein
MIPGEKPAALSNDRLPIQKGYVLSTHSVRLSVFNNSSATWSQVARPGIMSRDLASLCIKAVRTLHGAVKNLKHSVRLDINHQSIHFCSSSRLVSESLGINIVVQIDVITHLCAQNIRASQETLLKYMRFCQLTHVATWLTILSLLTTSFGKTLTMYFLQRHKFTGANITCNRIENHVSPRTPSHSYFAT